MSESTELVCAALVQCQGEVKSAEFDAVNPFFKSKYATLGSVIEASREALLKNGLAIFQVPIISENTVTLKTTIVHKSGQVLDAGAMSLGLGESDRNSDAQLAGSLITYLRRYSWSSVLGIYADSDSDGNDAPKGTVKPKTEDPKAPVIGPKYRLQTLNKLQAAPGQPNRALVEGYLRSKVWISGEQTADDFPLNQLPRTADDFKELTEAIQWFETQQREQAIL